MKILSNSLKPLKEWCQEYPVKLCVLFGSQTTNKTHKHSDVDLAVWPDESLPALTKLRWIRELETLLDKEISLVLVLADLDPVLGLEIFRQGHLIYEREPELWFHHRLQLWHRYNDSLPFLRAARQHLHKFAQEVHDGP